LATSGAFTTTLTVTGNTSVTLPTTGTLVGSGVTTLSSLTSIGTIGTGVWQGTAVVPQYGGTGLATITAHGVPIGEGTGTMVPVGGCTNGALWWSLSSSDPSCQTSPIFGSVASTGTAVIGGTGVAGAATTDVFVSKTVTGISDATGTAIFTVTVPNGGESAQIHLDIDGSLGAGGAVGAFECSNTLTGSIIVTRTSGVATVATAATASNTATSCVAGATTETLAYAVSGNTGANNATQTFNITATITKGGGGSGNHQVVARLRLLNAVASGVTIS
jgi:hypothetical protein